MFSALAGGLSRPARIASVLGGVLVVSAGWLAAASHVAAAVVVVALCCIDRPIRDDLCLGVLKPESG